MRFVLGSTTLALVVLLHYQSCAADDCCTVSGCASSCGCSNGGCCEDCGCCCRLVCEMKKIKKIKYECKCDEFCIPHETCHHQLQHECCEPKCACECDCDCCLEKHLKSLFCHDCAGAPCADVIPRRKLVMCEETCYVPVYKWILVRESGCCDQGCCSCSAPSCGCSDPSCACIAPACGFIAPADGSVVPEVIPAPAPAPAPTPAPLPSAGSSAPSNNTRAGYKAGDVEGVNANNASFRLIAR